MVELRAHKEEEWLEPFIINEDRWRGREVFEMVGEIEGMYASNSVKISRSVGRDGTGVDEDIKDFPKAWWAWTVTAEIAIKTP